MLTWMLVMMITVLMHQYFKEARSWFHHDFLFLFILPVNYK